MNTYTAVNANRESVELVAPDFTSALRFYRSLNENLDPINLYLSKQNIRMQEEIVDPLFDITIEGEGQVYPQSGSIAIGSQLIATAIPDPDNIFVEWEIDGVIFAENPLKFTVMQDTQIIARFAPE